VGFGKAHPQSLITNAFAQVVQVRRRQFGQAFVAQVAVVREGSPQEVNDGWAADIIVRFIHLHQTLDIERRLLARKRVRRSAVALDKRNAGQAIAEPLSHQPGDLGTNVAAGVLQVAQQYATVTPAAAGVVKALEYAADVGVTFNVAAVGRERDFGTSVKKLLDFFNRAKLGLIHVDHHS
jgi:hypothetical protein